MNFIQENLCSFNVSSHTLTLLEIILPSLPFFLEKDIKVQSSQFKSNLLPDGLLSLNPLLGALQFSPAVPLSLLAKLAPRMNRFLKEEQQAAADKVEEQRWKQKDTKYKYLVV